MNKLFIIFSLSFIFLVGCEKTDYVVEKSKTQYRHRQDEVVITYLQGKTALDSSTEKLLLKKLVRTSQGKSSIHFTLPKFLENTENAARVEQIKSFLMKSGVKNREIHFDDALQKLASAQKMSIKVDYYQVIPPRCDKHEYANPGNPRCAFDNNMAMMVMAMMVVDPAVFFSHDSDVSSRAVDGVEAIKAHDNEWSKTVQTPAAAPSAVSAANAAAALAKPQGS